MVALYTVQSVIATEQSREVAIDVVVDAQRNQLRQADM